MPLLDLESVRDSKLIKGLLIYNPDVISVPASVQDGYTALKNPLVVFQSPSQPINVFVLQLAWDSTFQANFKYYIEITPSTDISPQQFKTPFGSGVELCNGYKIRLPPNSTIKVYAYNANSSNSTNGTIMFLLEAETSE